MATICNNGCGEKPQNPIVQKIIDLSKFKWNGKKEEQEPGPYWKVPESYWKGFHGIGILNEFKLNHGTRKERQYRIRLTKANPNTSTKNRMIFGIKRANHIAKGIHYKDCPDVS